MVSLAREECDVCLTEPNTQTILWDPAGHGRALRMLHWMRTLSAKLC
jgi:hypothetical protein